MEIPCVTIKEINQNPQQNEEGPFRCSFCTKSFLTMQSLGGHQTIHRKEIKEMRLQHQNYMLTHHKRCAKEAIEDFRGKKIIINIPSKDDRLQMIPLIPNKAFWKAHKKLKHEPKLHDFFGISDHFAQIYPNCMIYDGIIDVDLRL